MLARTSCESSEESRRATERLREPGDLAECVAKLVFSVVAARGRWQRIEVLDGACDRSARQLKARLLASPTRHLTVEGLRMPLQGTAVPL